MDNTRFTVSHSHKKNSLPLLGFCLSPRDSFYKGMSISLLKRLIEERGMINPDLNTDNLPPIVINTNLYFQNGNQRDFRLRQHLYLTPNWYFLTRYVR